MANSTRALSLSTEQQEQIQQWLGAHGTPQQVALRCRIVLAAAQGGSDLGIAAALQVNRHTVRLWRKRFTEQGLKSLWEVAPGRGRRAVYGADKVKAVVDATLQTKPKGMTHWSCRLMAKHQGISKSTVSKIWRSHNLKPHRVKTFKLSRDRKFLEKLTDVIDIADQAGATIAFLPSLATEGSPWAGVIGDCRGWAWVRRGARPPQVQKPAQSHG